MRNLREWQVINEALQGEMALGISRPHTVGGIMGTHVSEGGFNPNDDDEDYDDEEDEDFDDEEDDGLEGDLLGTSDSDEGPDKGWPPQDGPEDFGGDDEGDDDFLASLGSGAGGKDIGPSDDMDDMGGLDDMGDMGGLDDMGGLEDLDGTSGSLGGDMGQEGEPDMSFLDDLPPDLLGGEGDDMGSDMGPEMGGEAPCPDCNAEGEHEIGEEGCQTCGGEGFIPDDGTDGDSLPDASIADDLGNDDDLGGNFGGDDVKPDAKMTAFMNHMKSYMTKYMKKEANYQEYAPALPQGGGYSYITPQQMQMQRRDSMNQPSVQQVPPTQQAAPQAQPPMNQQQNMKKMVKFMSKNGERSFMATDRKYMKKDTCARQHEGDDFFDSLIRNSARQTRGVSGISEDALFDLAAPDAAYAQDDPKAGDYGFAPQGRIGAVGGGYTKQDFEDLPVLGESVRFPTLTEYAVRKARAARNRK